MYDEELLERNLHPKFKGKVANTEPIKLVNSSCGDELEVFLNIENGVIVDGGWNGIGCAISLASAYPWSSSGLATTPARQALKAVIPS